VRIISGTYRGRQIHPPKGFKARPTTDFAKEGLFNILSNQLDMEELDVLDLFSGTGSISYEFASRGVRSVVAIESELANTRFIRSVCNALDLDQVSVIRGDAFRFLQQPVQSFDLIFADPPYNHPKLQSLPEIILTSNILNKDGVFILEHPSTFNFSDLSGFKESRKYGGVNFSMFKVYA
jgi:16S rRNA (guanine(966)-N(2))-methyltransferase RsmD